jgi:hypothetical protein
MNRIASVMAMHARDRTAWFLIPAGTLAAFFAIAWFIALSIDVLWGDATPVYTAVLVALFVVMMVEGIRSIGGTYPFAVGFSACRRDYLLGTLAWAAAVSAAWALALGLLSLVEAGVIKNWGVGLHFFHLPFFSDRSLLRQFCWSYYHDLSCARSDPTYLRGGVPLGQFWVYFVLLLFMSALGLLLGSIYQRFGRTGIYVSLGIAWLLLSVLLLASTVWSWWGSILGWLAGQTAVGLFLWLVPVMACIALACYALLRKATA